MRILFLSHYYPPEVNAPASRTSEHCREWVRAGHDVTVVTCAPNHPRGTLYPGYANKLWHEETIDGVRVVRLWTYLAANEGFTRRTLNYASYLATVTAALPHLPTADIVISTSPQFFCGLAGRIVRAAKRIPWVLEIRDLWPESIVTVGAMKTGPAIRALEALERTAYRTADAIVPVTNSYVPHIVARGGDASKITVLPNGVDHTHFQPDPVSAARLRHDLGFDGKFVASYVGTHGLAHGLDTLLDAAALLHNDPRIGFLLVGDGADRARLEAQCAARNLANTAFLGQRPKGDMPVIWTATDAGLILLRNDPLFCKVVPSKLFEAMAMGRPVVLGVAGESRALLETANAGIPVPPQDAAALAAAVQTLAANPARAAAMGASGKAYVRANHDRATLAASYLDILKSTIARTAALFPLPLAGRG